MSETLKLAVGIDIGGTNSVLGLVDRDGKILAEATVPTADYPDFEKYVEQLDLTIRNLGNSLDSAHQIVGIGIGAPNGNYFNGTIENPANLVWKGVLPLVDRLRVRFPGIPVALTNDANAAAVGEMVYGGARGMKDFIVITLGTGLGSGFVANGQLIYGHDSFAGELGHITINPAGRMCGCGRRGCLETYASASGIKRTIFKLLADHLEDSSFRKVSFNDLKAKEITDAALAGDPIAVEAFEHTGMVLGRTLANAIAVTSPEAIFLFGGLARAGKYLFEPTKRHMEANLLSNYSNKVKLLPSELMDTNAAVLGASSLAWQQVEAGAK